MRELLQRGSPAWRSARVARRRHRCGLEPGRYWCSLVNLATGHVPRKTVRHRSLRPEDSSLTLLVTDGPRREQEHSARHDGGHVAKSDVNRPAWSCDSSAE